MHKNYSDKKSAILSEELRKELVYCKRLDEIIDDYYEDPDLFQIIDEYPDKLSHSRESVEVLLDAIQSNDSASWELFKKLLYDFNDLLTPEEREHIMEEYYSKFDIPFDGENDDTE